MKRFSILIPVFNRQGLVRQAIESVLSQVFSDLELIVIDDGSTDRTPDVLRSYGERLRVVRQSNQGPEAARKAGAAQACGEYLAFLDSDDVFLPGALAIYDRIVTAFGAPPVVLGSMTYFHQSSYVFCDAGCEPGLIEIAEHRDFLVSDLGSGMSNSKIVIRRSVYDRVNVQYGGTASVFPMEDHDLLLRAGTENPCISIVRPHTVAYRVHGSNYVRDLEAMVGGTLALVKGERCGRYPGGRARRFDRRAYIGGKVHFWFRKAIKARRPDLVFKLVKNGGLMVTAAVLRKLFVKPAHGPRARVLEDPARDRGASRIGGR